MGQSLKGKWTWNLLWRGIFTCQKVMCLSTILYLTQLKAKIQLVSKFCWSCRYLKRVITFQRIALLLLFLRWVLYLVKVQFMDLVASLENFEIWFFTSGTLSKVILRFLIVVWNRKKILRKFVVYVKL